MRKDSDFLFISHGNSTNGAELCLAETVESLRLRGYKRIVVVLQYRPNSYFELLLRSNGAEIAYIKANPRWVGENLSWRKRMIWIWQSIRVFFQFTGILRKFRPVHVMTNSVVSSPVFGIASKLLGYPHVWYVHELADKDHGYRFYFGKRFTWSIVKLLSGKVVMNSEFTRRHFISDVSSDRDKVSVVYYGVPIDRFVQGDSGFEEGVSAKWFDLSVWRILVAGRTVKGKGQEDIIKALGILKQKYHKTNFHLTILGQVKGTYYDYLLDLIRENDLSDSIVIVPFTDNPARYFRDAHIGVTTSRNEAFGRITVEYLKSGMVAIGAHTGATDEIIEHGVNGYLYKAGNMDQFAELLNNVMSDPGEARRFADRARQGAEEKFSLGKHGLEMSKVLTVE